MYIIRIHMKYWNLTDLTYSGCKRQHSPHAVEGPVKKGLPEEGRLKCRRRLLSY